MVAVLSHVKRRWCLHREPVLPLKWVDLLFQALLALGQSLVLTDSHAGCKIEIVKFSLALSVSHQDLVFSVRVDFPQVLAAAGPAMDGSCAFNFCSLRQGGQIYCRFF